MVLPIPWAAKKPPIPLVGAIPAANGLVLDY